MENQEPQTQASDSTLTPIGALASDVVARYQSRQASDPDAERRAAERESQRAKLARHDEWRRLTRRLGARYEDCELENFEAKTTEQLQAKVIVSTFVAAMPERVNNGDGLVFYGPPGTGKDHLMVACLKVAVLAHGYTCGWINALDFFGEMRDAIGDDRSEAALVSRLCEPRILAISDPLPPIVSASGRSSGALTDFQAQTFLRVVDRRYRSRKPTWCTVNVEKGAEFGERASEPIFDRLRDNSVRVPCFWESYRARSHA